MQTTTQSEYAAMNYKKMLEGISEIVGTCNLNPDLLDQADGEPSFVFEDRKAKYGRLYEIEKRLAAE